MEMTQILAEVDSEIERLHRVKALLTGTSNGSSAPKTVGSPRKRRHLSAEARERIVAAQKKRWAKVRKIGS